MFIGGCWCVLPSTGFYWCATLLAWHAISRTLKAKEHGSFTEEKQWCCFQSPWKRSSMEFCPLPTDANSTGISPFWYWLMFSCWEGKNISALTALCTPASSPLIGRCVRLASQLNACSWYITSAMSIAHSDLYTNSKNMTTQKPLTSTFHIPLPSTLHISTSCISHKSSFCKFLSIYNLNWEQDYYNGIDKASQGRDIFVLGSKSP